MRGLFFSRYAIIFFCLVAVFLPYSLFAIDSLQYNLSITYPIESLGTSQGDIIIRDRYTNTLWLSSVEDSPDVFGVVSQNPMLVFRTDTGSVPIIRMGQVPVNVILKNGPIERGEHITTSNVVGFGQTVQPHHRYTIGVTLEQLTEEDTEESITMANGEVYAVGRVMVDLQIGKHGSGIVERPPRDISAELAEIGARELFVHNLGTIQYIGGRALDTSRRFLQNDVGVRLAQMVSILGIIAGFFMTLSAFFLSSLAILEVFFLPFRLWALLMAFLGFKSRMRPWGVVYDSITKQPIDPAYVQLFDEEGNEVKTSITDIDGRYGFLVESGRYVMKANKTNYSFPSKKLKDKSRDEIYDNLYFGEPLDITKEGAIVGKNIPMDPDNFDWNEFTKLNKNILNYYSYGDFFKAVILKWLFYIGFIVAVTALIITPAVYNILIVALYLLLFFMRLLGFSPRRYGKVLEKKTNTPLPYAIVRICLVESGKEAYKSVCDAYGRYFSLVTNGVYYASIDRKDGEDSYSNVYTSEPFEVKDGIIRKVFKV